RATNGLLGSHPVILTAARAVPVGYRCRSSRQRSARVERSDLVDEGGKPDAELGVVQLENVLRVHLTRVREVEAADEGDVVGDGDLRVHVVVDAARAVGRRALAG